MSLEENEREETVRDEESSNPDEDDEQENKEDASSEADGDGDGEEAAELSIEEYINQMVGKYTSQTVNDDIFEQLILPRSIIEEVQSCWQAFIDAVGSKDAAGEAMYGAIYDSSPILQSLFKTPRAVFAMRFVNALGQLVLNLTEPAALKDYVETLAFQHLDLEVTVPRCIVFRDAIVDLLRVELGAVLTPTATEGFLTIFNYVGGSYIYVRVNYSERLRLLASSWAMANKKTLELSESEERAEHEGQEHPESGETDAGQDDDLEKGHKSPSRTKKEKAGVDDQGRGKKLKSDSASASQGRNGVLNTSVPTNYIDMFAFNAAVMGFGSRTWMQEVLTSFDVIVTSVANSIRLQEECDVLSLRLAKFSDSSINLAEYKAVMLASLRSLVKDWGSLHEVSWSWLWENVERFLKGNMGKPAMRARALTRLYDGFDDETLDFIRRDVYVRFFALAPAGQDHFKQSTTRLHFIADKLMQMVCDMYKETKAVVEEISALGLRHVGYGIPTELVGPFVTAFVQVVRTLTEDDEAEESFRWSVSLISRILVRVINEGSTIVMKAINTNSAKQLRKAISCAPRSKRASWMLVVQVGTQSISPLYWAIQSGALDVAQAIIKDLLTIRADRQRYYYGCDDLFKRHPDIVERLCQDARNLVPTLLDGLVWRSRYVQDNCRRVNYYIEHVLVDPEGGISGALNSILNMQDPIIVCHPVVVYMCELIWSGPIYWSFLVCKAWLCLTAAIFVVAQSILTHDFGKNEQGKVIGDRTRVVTFVFRLFVYAFCMGQLAIYHVKESANAYRTGNVFTIYHMKIPSYLTGFQEFISLIQCFTLIAMFTQCPKLYCMQHWDGDYEGAGVLSDFCPEADDVRVSYGVASCLTMFLFFLRLTDFAVLSNFLCAYVIVASKMLKQVMLFFFALAFTILAFACAINALFQYDSFFKGIPEGSLSFIEMSVMMFNPTRYEQLSETGLIFAVVGVFVMTVQIFLVNLLVAQLCGEYRAFYPNMMGFARMHRITTIYSTVPYVRTRDWSRWIERLRLDVPLEFNQGDTGFAGGTQIIEPANLHPTTDEAIFRFGGSPSTPWPATDQDGEDQLGAAQRVDKLLWRINKKIGTCKGSAKGSSMGSGLFGKSGEGSSAASVPDASR